MVHKSYSNPTKYPFTLTRHNASGMIESEVLFEGFAQYFEDKQTECSTWEVEAWVTGFTQYLNGKVVSSVSGLKSQDWQVDDLAAFEADCVEAACRLFELKAA